MRTFIRKLIQTVAIITFVTAGIWIVEPVRVSAAELTTVAATQPIEEDYQACATLIGEGAECGWEEFDPNNYDPITGEPITQTVAGPQDIPAPPVDDERAEEPMTPCADGPDGVADTATLLCEVTPPPASQQVKCPVPVGEGVVCTGPQIPTDMPPTPEEPVQDDKPVQDNEIGGTDITPDSGQQPTPGIDTALDEIDSDPCESAVGEGMLGCGPEMPASGQGITMLRIFVPTVSK